MTPERSAAKASPSDDALLTQLMETGRIPITYLSLSRLVRLIDQLGIEWSEIQFYGDKAVVMRRTKSRES